LALIEQAPSGNPGASFDRNRVPSSPIAAGQHAALLIIDTACHGLRAVTGAIDCFAGGGALIRLFHINRPSIHGDRIVPAVNLLITFMRGRSTGNTWETHLNERFPLPAAATASARWSLLQPGAQSPRDRGVEG
jgi:hypothetical protein